MADIGSIWNELHNAALLLTSADANGLKTAENVFGTIHQVLNDDQLLSIIAIPDDPIVCMEAMKGLARRYNQSHSQGNNGNVWKVMLKLSMNSPHHMVYSTGFTQIASILGYHYDEYLFTPIEPSELRVDFVQEIELYINETYLTKVMLFLSEVVEEVTRGWRSHCHFGVASATRIRGNSRDLLVPTIFQWLQNITGFIVNIRGAFTEDQCKMYSAYLGLYQSLLRFNSPYNASLEDIEAYALPRVFETDVRMIVDIPMIVLRRCYRVPSLVYKVLEVFSDLAGHKISQAISNPINEANQQLTANLADSLTEIIQWVPETYSLELLSLLKNFVIGLPYDYPAHELAPSIYTASISVFKLHLSALDDATTEAVIDLRDIWRRIRDRSEGKLDRNFSIQLLAKMLEIVEVIVLSSDQIDEFFELDAVKGIGSAFGLLAQSCYQSTLEMFTEKLVTHIERGTFVDNPVNAAWNLFLFSECVLSLINAGGSDVAKTYYNGEPPAFVFKLRQLYDYPYDQLTTSLAKVIAASYHCLNVVRDASKNYHPLLAACSMSLVSSTILLSCKLEDDEGVFKSEKVLNDVFDTVFIRTYDLAVMHNMRSPIGYELGVLTKNMILNDLFMGHEDELHELLKVCLKEESSPPHFTGCLVEAVLRPGKNGDVVGNTMADFFAKFTNCAKSGGVVDPKYANFAFLQLTGIFNEAGYLEYSENMSREIMNLLGNALNRYGHDDEILQNGLRLFKEVSPSFLSYLMNKGTDVAMDCFGLIFDVVDIASVIGDIHWARADDGRGSYDGFLLVIEACSEILERLGILDLGDDQETIVYSVVSHLVVSIVSMLNETRIMCPEIAKAVFGLLRNVCEISTALYGTELTSGIVSTLQEMLIFGLDSSRDKEICDMVLCCFDHLTNKMSSIPEASRPVWIEFFKSLFAPTFKVAFEISSTSDTFRTLSNFFFNVMTIDPEYHAQFFRSFNQEQAYQEEVNVLVMPFTRETHRAKRCEYRERFLHFTEKAHNWIHP